jgi:hypothetical protein
MAGVLDRFLTTAAESVDPSRRPAIVALSVPPGDGDQERERAGELLTRTRDWAAAALGRSDRPTPMLPPPRVSSGDDAFARRRDTRGGLSRRATVHGRAEAP